MSLFPHPDQQTPGNALHALTALLSGLQHAQQQPQGLQVQPGYGHQGGGDFHVNPQSYMPRGEAPGVENVGFNPMDPQFQEGPMQHVGGFQGGFNGRSLQSPGAPNMPRVLQGPFN